MIEVVQWLQKLTMAPLVATLQSIPFLTISKVFTTVL